MRPELEIRLLDVLRGSGDELTPTELFEKVDAPNMELRQALLNCLSRDEIEFTRSRTLRALDENP